MYLIIDNYDSFTYNLADLVAETGRDVEVRPCDAIGQDFEKTTPILGICLGMEVLAYAAGASVIRGKRPMHGKVTAIHHDGRGLFKGLPKTFSVTRYHSLVVQKSSLPPAYRIDAVSDDGAVMALSHKKRPLFGLQFHPEALLSEYGSDLIQAFCRCAEKGGRHDA